MGDLRERARDLYKDGGTIRGIARELGVTPDRAHRWVTDLCIERRHARHALRDEARSLRAQGLKRREIAARLGVSAEQAGYLANYAYEARYSGGVKWTRDRVVEAMNSWATEHGRPPFSPEWCPPPRGSGWPSVSTVIRLFGSWNAAMEVAGFEARPSHIAIRPPARDCRGRTREEREALRARARGLRAEGATYQQIAEALGVHVHTAYSWVRTAA
jgi:transposase